MDRLTWLASGFVALIGALLLNMLASEIYDWSGKWAERLVRVGAALLPKKMRKRYQEEWLAHLADCPGKLSKLRHGLGALISARRMAESENRKSKIDTSNISRVHKIAFLGMFSLLILTAAGSVVSMMLGTRLSDVTGVPANVIRGFGLFASVVAAGYPFWFRFRGRRKLVG